MTDKSKHGRVIGRTHNSIDIIQETEWSRVQAILDRDAKDRDRDRDRKLAEEQLAAAGYANAEHLAVPATDEWLAKGDVRTVQARRDHWMDRSISTVRRVSSARVIQLFERGVIDDDGLKVCLWYRAMYERANLDGGCAIANYSGGGFSARTPPVGLLARTEEEYVARDAYHRAKESLRPRYRWLFEAIALQEKTLGEAARIGKFRARSATVAFKQAVAALAAKFLAEADDWTGEKK